MVGNRRSANQRVNGDAQLGFPSRWPPGAPAVEQAGRAGVEQRQAAFEQAAPASVNTARRPVRSKRAMPSAASALADRCVSAEARGAALRGGREVAAPVDMSSSCRSSRECSIYFTNYVKKIARS